MLRDDSADGPGLRSASRNVLGEPLEACSTKPMTGFYRDGCCNTAMARDGDDRLKSITLLAAQTDFTEAGELMLFINESQLAFLEDMMWEQGFLDTTQMAGAFQMLRSHDLFWSGMIREYLMGERDPMIDLMAWNADATRLPYRMHSEYLQRLFLNNDLAEGRFIVAGKPIALTDIRAPIFTVGTVHDHVAPWRSTYKINLQTEADVTYLLTSGGHNAGVISEPGHDGHSFQVMTKRSDNHYVDPDAYLAEAPRKDGSWWPEWVAWLESIPMAQARRQNGRSCRGLCPALRRPRNLCVSRMTPCCSRLLCFRDDAAHFLTNALIPHSPRRSKRKPRDNETSRLHYFEFSL